MTDNVRALAALREWQSIPSGWEHDDVRADDAWELLSAHADTLIGALELVERVRVAPTGKVLGCSGSHYEVQREGDPRTVYERLTGQRVALLALPIDTPK